MGDGEGPLGPLEGVGARPSLLVALPRPRTRLRVVVDGLEEGGPRRAREGRGPRPVREGRQARRVPVATGLSILGRPDPTLLRPRSFVTEEITFY